MRRSKKMTSLLVTSAMMLSTMATAAMAATITIDNAYPGKEYAVYKVFGIEASDDSTTDDVKYIYTVSEDWAEIIGDSELFTVADDKTTTCNATNNADIIAFFNGISKDDLPDATKTVDNAATGKAVFADLDEGYYFITSELGSVVSLVNVDDTVTIIDKNQGPSWEDEDPDDPDDPTDDEPANGKYVKNADGDWVTANDAVIGANQEFMINAFAPKYTEQEEVVAYTITDKYGEAFENVADITVKIDGDIVKGGVINKDGVDIIEGDGFFKVVINVDKVDYAVGHVSITYTADVTDVTDNDHVNTASLDWTKVPYNPENPYDTSEDPSDVKPVNPDAPDDEKIYTPVDPEDDPNGDDPEAEEDTPEDAKTDTYTYVVNLKKIDKDTQEVIEATFNIKQNDTAILFVQDSTGDIVEYVKGEAGADYIYAGEVVIKGLLPGEYTIVEEAAPDGYIQLADPVTLKIDSMLDANAENPSTTVTMEIKNAKEGSTLPTTGGVGTTIFYIVGSLMVIGAAVVLITRKMARR